MTLLIADDDAAIRTLVSRNAGQLRGFTRLWLLMLRER